MADNKSSEQNSNKGKGKGVQKNQTPLPKASDPKVIFNQLPPDQQQQLIFSFMMQSHSGPIPDPETLARYNQIIPNGADRIMKMAEDQSQHRISLEAQVIPAQLKQSGRGQIFALVIGLASLVALVICAFLEQPIAALGSGILAAGGLISAFLKGSGNQKKELNAKRDAITKKD